jgi:uracil-DNA glycosylase
MQDVHGHLFKGNAEWGQLSILPMYHPAATFYGSLSKADLQQDFDVLHELLNGD